MNLLAPGALALAIVAAPIVALYVLKMRRPTRVVPSAFLWDEVLRDVQANAPWQRLRPNPLLLLQLLAVAALVLALARPYTLRAAVASGDVVAVLDASTLMGATDVAPSRFAAARARVSTLIDGLGANSAMSIVLMARHPRILVAQSADRAALHAALDAARTTSERADQSSAAAAMAVAAALARGDRDAALFVYSAAGGPALVPPPGLAANARVAVIGSDRLRDLGIANLAASRAPDGTVSVLARIANPGRRAASSSFALDALIDPVPDPRNPAGREVDLRPVALAPGGTETIVRTSLPAGVVAVRGRLLTSDDLASDDWAWAAVPQITARRVVLVTRGNPYLQLALGLAPGVRVDAVAPEVYNPARAGCADATVFDDEAALPARLPLGPILAIGPPASTEARTVLGLSIARPAPVAADRLRVGDDPDGLTRDAQAAEVGISRASALGVPPWGYAVLRESGAGGAPVFVAGQNGPRREAVLGFSLYDSNWPVLPGFPILVGHVLDWLAPPSSTGTAGYQPADSVALAVSACATSLAVVDPTGARTPLPVGAGSAAPSYAGTEQLGLYTVEQGEGEGRGQGRGVARAFFAVNAFPTLQALVSTSTTASAAPSAATVVAARSATARVTGAQIPVEWTPLAAALALLILSGEWWVASRRR